MSNVLSFHEARRTLQPSPSLTKYFFLKSFDQLPKEGQIALIYGIFEELTSNGQTISIPRFFSEFFRTPREVNSQERLLIWSQVAKLDKDQQEVLREEIMMLLVDFDCL